jgi:hypothetical protein
MAGEEWARRIVQNELGQVVEVNDNGSAASMYDLRIGSADAPDFAIEVVGAVDQRFTERWNIGSAKGPWQLSIDGDWSITITTNTPVKHIRQRIERLLQDLEARTIRDVMIEDCDESVSKELEALGITRASCRRLPGTGRVYLWMPARGGGVEKEGSTTPQWLGEFLRDPRRKDVVRKLKESGARERHVFVIVTFGGAPWSVESYLTGDLKQLPSQAPNLPPPITGAWVVWALGQKDQEGLRWDGSSWRLFRARGMGIDG